MRALACLLVLCSASCGAPQRVTGDERLAIDLGRELAAACPIGDDPGDESARTRCANLLTVSPLLQGSMNYVFLWGGQRDGYRLDHGTTRFDPRVWRRLYLSTFMVSQNFWVQRVGVQTVLHVPVRFRGFMPIGAYPYPFWHSDRKWDSYNYSTTIHFVIEGGKVLGALRGSDQDRSRPKVGHSWDNEWRWDSGGMPYVSLYDYLLSHSNPFRAVLDSAYR